MERRVSKLSSKTTAARMRSFSTNRANSGGRGGLCFDDPISLCFHGVSDFQNHSEQKAIPGTMAFQSFTVKDYPESAGLHQLELDPV
jgi:hypothetical protein